MKWVEGNTIGVRTDNSAQRSVVFLNTYTGDGMADLPPNTWSLVDVTKLGVPSDAKSVFITGILVITHGTTPQICDLHFTARAPGDDLNEGNYIGQAVEAHVGGGQRSNMSTWVPVVDGKIEVHWTRSTTGQWPTECAYGMSLVLQAYVR